MKVDDCLTHKYEISKRLGFSQFLSISPFSFCLNGIIVFVLLSWSFSQSECLDKRKFGALALVLEQKIVGSLYQTLLRFPSRVESVAPAVLSSNQRVKSQAYKAVFEFLLSDHI